MLKPLKLPMKAWSPLKARSEVDEAEVARVGRVDEAGGLVVVRELLHVADGRLGVEPARAETDPRIALRRR